ncbi:zinc finger protein RFP [Astyanax mexicanus]|uniref:zinc finger protein RFP n=1 Tax=Astyanax mexicanus TaxID=7994 RepID=UPI0020CAC244|nr:zinc finger protein RFP [Astyanax mexicanus]
MASALSEDQFKCCICLDFFNQPVSIPCGHNFCLLCIQQFWNTATRINCPLCKESFPTRPKLSINRALAEITEGFKTSLNISPDQPNSKSRSQSVKGEDERISSHEEPRRNLCGKHRKPLEFYCKTEKIKVCSKCVETQHQGHQTVHVELESIRMRADLNEVASKLQQMIQDREKKGFEIKRSAELHYRSLNKETEQSIEIFNSLKCSFQSELAELAEKQREVTRNADSLSEELQKEIDEIKMKKCTVEQLASIDDDLQLLQNFHSVASLPRTKNWSQTRLITSMSTGTLRRTIEALKEVLRNQEKILCDAELHEIQQYEVDITFDPQTAAPWLVLSSNLKQASLSVGGFQPAVTPSSPSPLRFDSCVCVLGQPGVSSGRHYWVVQVRDKTDWELGVARESINRKGAISVRPDQGFWAVASRKGGHLVACAGPAVTLFSPVERLQRVGVFVDYEGGTVSFYDVESRSHIYSYTRCSFTERLYPYFNPCLHDDGKNTAPLIICPVGGGEVATSDLNQEARRPPPLIRRQSSQGFLLQTTKQ